MSQEDASRVKKSILMRYPLSYLEEVSRELITYKSWRDNKHLYKALPIFDSLIDYVTLDPITRKRIYELSETERKATNHHFIEIPEQLVKDFKAVFHGPRAGGKIALRFLSPGTSLDLKRGYVKIKAPVNFLKAWKGFDPQDIIMRGGFFVRRTSFQQSPYGPMPVQELVPLIDFSDPNLQYYDTNTIPFTYWAKLYESGWTELSEICTMIEKIIAHTLQEAGFDPSLVKSPELPKDDEEDSLML